MHAFKVLSRVNDDKKKTQPVQNSSRASQHDTLRLCLLYRETDVIQFFRNFMSKFFMISTLSVGHQEFLAV